MLLQPVYKVASAYRPCFYGMRMLRAAILLLRDESDGLGALKLLRNNIQGYT